MEIGRVGSATGRNGSELLCLCVSLSRAEFLAAMGEEIGAWRPLIRRGFTPMLHRFQQLDISEPVEPFTLKQPFPEISCSNSETNQITQAPFQHQPSPPLLLLLLLLDDYFLFCLSSTVLRSRFHGQWLQN